MTMSLIIRFTTTMNGAITFTGNTLGLSKEFNLNAIGTHDSIGTFVTLNTGSVVDDFPPGTTLNWPDDSAAAILNLPPFSTVLYAELVWGGEYRSGAFDVSSFLNNPVTLTAPSGTFSVTPDPATAVTIPPPPPPGTTIKYFYARSADVTSLIQSGGAGTYSVGGVPAVADPLNNEDNCAGWTLAVVYGNPTLPSRNMTLFVGLEPIITPPTPAPVDFTVSGFATPVAGPFSARVLVSAEEGDANKYPDMLYFGPNPASPLFNPLSGPNNPVDNFFCSQINNDSGNLDTSGTFGTRNADPFTHTLVPGGRQGWDITNVDGSANLANGQTTADVRLTTTGDSYAVNAIAIQIDVNAPVLTAVKSVDKTLASVGDTLTYTVVITNTGYVDAVNSIFTDTAPPGTVYIPGTFMLNGVTVSGADPNIGVNIGTIPAQGSVTVTFQVTITEIPVPNPLVNLAAVDYQYQSVPDGPIMEGEAISNQVSTTVIVPPPPQPTAKDCILINKVYDQCFTEELVTGQIPVASFCPGVTIPPGSSAGCIPIAGSQTCTFAGTVAVTPPLTPFFQEVLMLNSFDIRAPIVSPTGVTLCAPTLTLTGAARADLWVPPGTAVNCDILAFGDCTCTLLASPGGIPEVLACTGKICKELQITAPVKLLVPTFGFCDVPACTFLPQPGFSCPPEPLFPPEKPPAFVIIRLVDIEGVGLAGIAFSVFRQGSVIATAITDLTGTAAFPGIGGLLGSIDVVVFAFLSKLASFAIPLEFIDVLGVAHDSATSYSLEFTRTTVLGTRFTVTLNGYMVGSKTRGVPFIIDVQ